jgi:16S rRNA (uracil1498-N3)-methyltransferase
MSQYDFKSPRLFVDVPLAGGTSVPLDRNQGNYLGNVLRLSDGDAVLVFNGRDGEWRADLSGRKRADQLIVREQVREQTSASALRLMFAPIKHARLDYMVQKAVEMGAGTLQPVITRFTQVARVNSERMRSNVIEAAEQCGILSIPTVEEPAPLDRYLDRRNSSHFLIFCDEDAPSGNPLSALAPHKAAESIDLLIGPEGGFSPEERATLLQQPNIVRLSLGPRILRADTAAVAAMAVIQAALGDWAGKP